MTTAPEPGRRSFLVGLVGEGIQTSLTPPMHEREAERQGLRYVYKTIDLDERRRVLGDLPALLAAAVELGFDGLNVTHPVKQEAVPLVDAVVPAVAAIGALNTIVVDRGRTEGHNTDVTGFARAFREGLAGATLERVVLLGAGGAGTAVAHALARLGVRRLAVVEPDRSRAAALTAAVRRARPGLEVESVPPDDAGALVAAADGLVNATPVGMAARPGSPLDTRLLRPDLWVADIVYRPLVTELLSAARSVGCRTLDGAGMAVHQAADAFELFTGRAADRAAMFRDFDDMVAAETARARDDNQPRQHPGERN